MEGDWRTARRRRGTDGGNRMAVGQAPAAQGRCRRRERGWVGGEGAAEGALQVTDVAVFGSHAGTTRRDHPERLVAVGSEPHLARRIVRGERVCLEQRQRDAAERRPKGEARDQAALRSSPGHRKDQVTG